MNSTVNRNDKVTHQSVSKMDYHKMAKPFHSSLTFTSIWIVSIWWLLSSSQGDLFSTISSRIKLNYSYFPKDYRRRGCFAEEVAWSRAPFSFDKLNRGRSLNLNSTTFDKQLVITCVADEPLLWVLNIKNDVVVKTSSHYLRHGDDNSSQKYHVCIILKNLRRLSGSLRCESVYNESFAAEIFISNEEMDTRWDTCTDSYVPFIPQSHGNGSRNVIPCVTMGNVPSNRTLRLLSSTQGAKHWHESSGKCLKCVCNANKCSLSSDLLAEIQGCKRFKIGRQFWGANVENQTCPSAASGYTFEWPSENYDNCTVGDESIHCTDICLRKAPDCSNNYSSAACLIEIKSMEIPDEQLVEYDYRIGFLLNETVDYEATYVCAGDEKIGIQHYYPLRQEDELNSTLELLRDRFDETTGRKALSGIVCTVDSFESEDVSLSMTPCESLTRCPLRGEEGFRYPYTAEKSKMETGMPIRQRFESSERIGQVIDSPSTAGLVSCIGLFENSKYIQKFDYFYIGIDLRPYMASENPPLSAILVLRQLDMSPEFSNTFKYSFECIISTFIFYRTVEVTLDFKGGRSDTVHLHAPPNHNVTMQTELYILDGVNKTRDTQSRVLINVTTDDLISVTCAAPYSNTVGWERLTLKLEVKADNKDLPLSWITPVLSIAATIVTVSVVISMIAILKYRKSKKIIRSLSEKEVEEFHNGTAEGFVNKSDGLNVDAMAFPSQYRIASASLQINTTEVLGEGEFGRCLRGEFGGQPVAVKVLKSCVDVEYFKNFLREVKLLAHIGYHENVVRFYGAAVDKITENLCEVVVELSPHGDLQAFLKKQSHIKPGESCINISRFRPYKTIISSVSATKLPQVIHGDLAARNVLVFENYKVKITDFGLSRKLYDTAKYTKKNRMVRLPWRWMSLESLKYLEFSTFSDVWSFGVTAWEIFTLGQVPFAGFNWTADFIDMVEQGLRLGKPHRATQEIYEHLKMCWHEQPDTRPSFSNIKNIFGGLMEAS